MAKKPRKPLSAEQKTALLERLKKAREARANKTTQNAPQTPPEAKKEEKKGWVGGHTLDSKHPKY